MKYLYKILRLFFCPHKYSKLLKSGRIIDKNNKHTGDYYNKECKYCGVVKSFETI